MGGGRMTYPTIYLTIKRAEELGVTRGELYSYPNFSATGSIRGMKDKYYGKDATLVRYRGYIYNVPMELYKKCAQS